MVEYPYAPHAQHCVVVPSPPLPRPFFSFCHFSQLRSLGLGFQKNVSSAAVAVVGADGCGKTSLCISLSRNCPIGHVPSYTPSLCDPICITPPAITQPAPATGPDIRVFDTVHFLPTHFQAKPLDVVLVCVDAAAVRTTRADDLAPLIRHSDVTDNTVIALVLTKVDVYEAAFRETPQQEDLARALNSQFIFRTSVCGAGIACLKRILSTIICAGAETTVQLLNAESPHALKRRAAPSDSSWGSCTVQ